MIYTDGVHLISDISDTELHVFAQGIGLKREWFQDKRHRHYDLMGCMVDRALAASAKQVTTRELVRKLHALKMFGIYDTRDKCWLGNDDGPSVFFAKDLARLAAQVANTRIGRQSQDIKVRPYILQEPVLKDKVDTRMSGEEAIKHLEEGGL